MAGAQRVTRGRAWGRSRREALGHVTEALPTTRSKVWVLLPVLCLPENSEHCVEKGLQKPKVEAVRPEQGCPVL